MGRTNTNDEEGLGNGRGGSNHMDGESNGTTEDVELTERGDTQDAEILTRERLGTAFQPISSEEIARRAASPTVWTSSSEKEKKGHRTAYDYMCIIGKGSFGEVARVRRKSTKQHFAMKINDIKKMAKLLHVPKERSGGSHHKNLARRSSVSEEKIMQLLDFPFIVKLKDCFRTYYHSFIVMEFVKGQTLADILEEKEKVPVNYEQARRWASEIFLCLKYLHGLGIVHRDLKPDNIMIGESQHVKIMDFGVAFRVDYGHGKTGSSRKIGARGFKAPEMLTGKEYGFSIDWWNFGVILYIMMTGSHPFHKKGGWKGLFGRNEDKNALKKEVKYPKTMSPEAKDLISKLLVRDPWKRLGLRMANDKDQDLWETLKAKKIEKDKQLEAKGKGDLDALPEEEDLIDEVEIKKRTNREKNKK